MTGADLAALIKKHPIAFACGLVVLACVGWLYVYSDAIDQARSTFEEKDKESQKIALNARNAAGLGEQTAEFQAATRQMESRLLHVGDLANNLQLFYRLENDTGIKLVDARQSPVPTPKQGAPKTLYVGIPFNVTIQGNYQQVWSFIRRAETLPQFSRFTKVLVTKIETGAQDLGPDAMNANLTLELLGTP